MTRYKCSECGTIIESSVKKQVLCREYYNNGLTKMVCFNCGKVINKKKDKIK